MSEPHATRPPFPDLEPYGPQRSRASEPLRPWAESRERLIAADLYWMTATRRDGRPHAVPIGGAWSVDRLWFNSAPSTVLSRILRRNPRALMHLESGEDVLIVEGEASLVGGQDVPDVVVTTYRTKYGGDWDPHAPHDPWLWFVLIPRSAMTWSYEDMRNTAVRYDFEGPRSG